jgi:hypothetical protein
LQSLRERASSGTGLPGAEHHWRRSPPTSVA